MLKDEVVQLSAKASLSLTKTGKGCLSVHASCGASPV